MTMLEDLADTRDPVLTAGERIRKARSDAGLDQAQLAAAIGVARPTISSWERGRTLPDIEKAARIAEACQVSFGWLCGVPLRSR